MDGEKDDDTGKIQSYFHQLERCIWEESQN